jgi:hypothetical protein
MTVVPPGPDPAALVTDDAVAAAYAAYQKAWLTRNQSNPLFAEHVVRDILEAAAFPIVAAWQHWEEDQL